MKLKWNIIDKSTYETYGNVCYFHLRKERNEWILDIFRVSDLETDVEKAHIESLSFATMKIAKEEAELYELDEQKKE